MGFHSDEFNPALKNLLKKKENSIKSVECLSSGSEFDQQICVTVWTLLSANKGTEQPNSSYYQCFQIRLVLLEHFQNILLWLDHPVFDHLYIYFFY